MKKYTLVLKGIELAVLKDALESYMTRDLPSDDVFEYLYPYINIICEDIIEKIDETGFM